MKKYWFYLAYIYLINLLVKVGYTCILSFRNILLINLLPLLSWYKNRSINLIGFYIMAKLELIGLRYTKLHHISKTGRKITCFCFTFFPVSTEYRNSLSISRSCSQSEYWESLKSSSIYAVGANDKLYKANVLVPQRPVNPFALQINWLISVWHRSSRL